MFLFQSIPWYSWLMFFIVLGGLMLFNEIGRYNKYTGIALFIVLPILLTIFVWPNTSGAKSGQSTANWFQWAKTYSALAGCIIFMGLRFSKKIQAKKWYYVLPPAILAINITEAVIREFQVYGMNETINGMTYIGGPWNIMNGIAGILNILTICGWFGIIVSTDKQKDMIWPDMLWFWIIAYDLWNFGYLYNCVTDRAFYGGLALLLSCTIPAFSIKKGAWLQHRAQTLALWMMVVMIFPGFFTGGKYAVASTHNPRAYMVVSIIALAANILVVAYQVRTIVKNKKNPLKDEIYTELKSYNTIKKSNM
ncbi:hypothetical protein DVW05_02865 [Clostridium botulinum]|uniref:DUF5692 family protein n=1 Tax=unclassified Clostridium TaxID=2614128 RepID=UPI000312BE1B|nr:MULTISPECIES: DUF5692 family protein [unclassified Clostridium]MBN1050990.1 hypothetical protein [Clostridium botulinum]MBN1054286.1 hypothetical protein [Clostridium botulinum]